VEDSMTDGLGNTAPGVPDRDEREVAIPPRLDTNSSLGLGASNDVADGVRGVHDDVEKDLVELADVTHDRRKIPEVRLDLRDVFVFVPCDRNGRFERMVQVGGGLFLLVRVCE